MHWRAHSDSNRESQVRSLMVYPLAYGRIWRREWDLNPRMRTNTSPDFKSGALNQTLPSLHMGCSRGIEPLYRGPQPRVLAIRLTTTYVNPTQSANWFLLEVSANTGVIN